MKLTALVILLATTSTALADDCRPAARGYFSATSAVAEAIKLVDTGTKGWSDLKADDTNRAAYEAANTALGAYAGAVDGYASAVKDAEPLLATCNAKGELAATEIGVITLASTRALAVLDAGQAYLKAFTAVAPSAPAVK